MSKPITIICPCCKYEMYTREMYKSYQMKCAVCQLTGPNSSSKSGAKQKFMRLFEGRKFWCKSYACDSYMLFDATRRD